MSERSVLWSTEAVCSLQAVCAVVYCEAVGAVVYCEAVCTCSLLRLSALVYTLQHVLSPVWKRSQGCRCRTPAGCGAAVFASQCRTAKHPYRHCGYLHVPSQARTLLEPALHFCEPLWSALKHPPGHGTETIPLQALVTCHSLLMTPLPATVQRRSAHRSPWRHGIGARSMPRYYRVCVY